MRNFFLKYKQNYASLLSLGVPIMIGQLGIIIVGFVDNIMVGHHMTNELSAASFVNNLFTLPIMFGMGFSLGLTPVISGLAGKNQLVRAGQTLRTSLWINFILSLVLIGIMTVVYFNIDKMNQPEELLPLIKPYYLIHLSGLVFVMLFNSFKQFVDGIMDTKTSMYILIASNILNIIGNYLLIFGNFGFPEIGLLGAGISTLISRIFALLVFVYLFFLTQRYNRFRKGFIQMPADKSDRWKLTRIGFPIALQMGMETGAFNLSVIMMGWLGSAALAAHQVVGTFTTIGFMLYYGIGSAVTILISNKKSTGNYTEIRNIASSGLHLITAMAFIIIIVMGLLRNHIGYLFTDSDEVSALVALLIIPTMFYQFGDGLQVTYANALRGIEDVKLMAVIAFISYFLICLPCAYLFGFVLDGGAMGVWWGFPIGLTVAGCLFYIRFRWMIGKKIKKQA